VTSATERGHATVAVVMLATLSAAPMCGGEEAAAPQAKKALDPQKYADYMARYPFGGQRLEWWRAELAALAPGGARPDATLYALTKERAERNGLQVDGAEVKPGPAVAAQMMKRLGVE
jgi:hypothetical protein